MMASKELVTQNDSVLKLEEFLQDAAQPILAFAVSYIKPAVEFLHITILTLLVARSQTQFQLH